MKLLAAMSFPKVVNNDICLCHNGVNYSVPDDVLNLHHLVPGVTTTNIRSLKVLLTYRKDIKSVKLLGTINEFEESNESIFFSSSKKLCYGNPVKGYEVIEPEQLESILNYPTVYIGKTKLPNHSKGLLTLYTILICVNNHDYGNCIHDILMRMDRRYYIMFSYFLFPGEMNNRTDLKTFFFFKNKIFYGNIDTCEEITNDIIYERYSVDKLKTLSMILRNVKDHNYESIVKNIGKYCNVQLNEEQKEILKTYASKITYYDTQGCNYSYPDILFFKSITVINTNRSLMDYYEQGFGNVDDIKETINIILSN